MLRVSAILQQLRRPPYGRIVVRSAALALLGGALAGVSLFAVAPSQQRLARAEAEWTAGQRQVALRTEAREAQKRLAAVLKSFPEHRDFAQLPLAISETARRDRVSLAMLTYALGKPEAGGFSKAVLKGSASGRYEDLRAFIHDLEASDGFLFIEDLGVGRQGAKTGGMVTVQVTVSTYIREPRDTP